MALNCFVGNFLVNTGTGALTVTGVGFTPKALIFFTTRKNGVGDQAQAGVGIGFATSSSAMRTMCCESMNNNNPATSTRSLSAIRCFTFVSETGTTLYSATLTSFNPDGFTLDQTVADGAQHTVGFMALGGSDLTSAMTGTMTPAASTGNQSFTGVGFSPDCVLAMNIGANGQGGNYNLGFNIFTSTTNRVNAIASQNNVSPSNTRKVQLNSAYLQTSSTANTTTQLASFVSMDPDGFTLNFSASSNANVGYYLALKGAQFAVGVLNQSTSTGNQSVSGLSFTPVGILLNSVNAVASASYTDTVMDRTFSIADATQKFMIYNGELDNLATSNCSSHSATDTLYKSMTANGATPSTETVANFVSMDTTGFTINNTTVDATSREVIYLALGSNPAVPGGHLPGFKSLLGFGR